MKGRTRLLWLLPWVLLAVGCPGDGSLIDQMLDVPDGRDDACPPANPPAAPTLDELQQDVFGAICIFCHVEGGIGPFRLDTAEQSFQNLVNVPSLCSLPSCAGLDRVVPCDADNSYLVWKLEGHPGIQGSQMPLGLPRLSAEQIAAIRAWIEAGALP